MTIHWERHDKQDLNLAIDLVNRAKDNAIPYTVAVDEIASQIAAIRRAGEVNHDGR